MRASRRSRLLALAATLAAVVPLAVARPAGASAVVPVVADPASLVNPLIGTGVATAGKGGGGIAGGGDTFPGPDMPFGMIQWSPDTAPQRQNGGGYWYNSDQLTGFSLDHLSGAGCPVYGDVPILPFVGGVPADPAAATASFSHASETAKAGYYAVTTSAPDGSDPVATELSTTTRAGIARFAFPSSAAAGLLLKVADSATKIVDGKPKYQKVDATTAQVLGDDEVIGSVTAGHFCNIGSSNQRDYTLHFDIRFSQPFTANKTWPGGPTGDPGGVALSFDTSGELTVTAKVGISYTSDANAAANLDAEIPGWDLDAVRAASVQAWNQMLSRIEIGGGSTDQQTVFYTALYHSLLDPHVFSDANGQYLGMDGQVHVTAPGHEQYADYSGWDIYRDQVQLAALVAPHETSDVIRSMLNDYAQDGILPKWSNANGESFEMVGDPADAIISDAYAFGATDFDTSAALRAMIDEATSPNAIRPGQAALNQYGYLPNNVKYECCNFSAAVSTQLEYESADYGIAAFAKALHQQDVYATFAARAQNWQNAFNPATGYVQAKRSDGTWVAGFTPGTSTGMIEGSAAEYTPMVPFNIQGLVAARGGPAAWQAYLDDLTSNLVVPGPENANLSNEPSLAIPWEYDYVGEPWKTQEVVRRAQVQLFLNAPAGEPGNDDLGAMGSWYVWSSLGMYPETPGTDVLVLGSPAFPHAALHLASGRAITVDAPNAAVDAPYVQGLRLNGDAWPKLFLTASQYAQGAQLDFDLGAAPGTWGTGPSATPPSDATGAAPAIPFVSPAGVTVAPGEATATQLSVRNVTASRVTAVLSAAPPAGIAVTPVSATVQVPANSTSKTGLNLSVVAGTAPGTYYVPVTVSAGPDGPPRRVTLSVTVPKTAS